MNENENKSSKISIIIPAFNADKTILNCLESIALQTYSNFEVIVIDDGSMDRTYDIINNFKHTNNEYVLKLYKTLNRGASSARNIGIDNADGDYIVFVDADDTIKKDYLESLILSAIQNDADIVISGITIYNQSDNTVSDVLPNGFNNINNRQKTFWNDLYFLQQTSGLLGYVSNKLYKKECICKIRFDTSKILQEDLDFALRVINNSNTIAFLNKSSYNYLFCSKNHIPYSNINIIDNFLFFSTKVGIQFPNTQLDIFKRINNQLHIYLYTEDDFNKFKCYLPIIIDNPIYRNLYSTFKHNESFFYKLVYKFIHLKAFGIAYIFTKMRKRISKVLHKT